MKKKLSIPEFYKIITIVVVVISIIIFYAKFYIGENGQIIFSPIQPGEQYWSLVATLLTSLFISKIYIPASKSIQHISGIVMVVLVLLVSFTTFFKIISSPQLWVLVGSILAFSLRSTPENDD